jgi:hypothetical protein
MQAVARLPRRGRMEGLPGPFNSVDRSAHAGSTLTSRRDDEADAGATLAYQRDPRAAANQHQLRAVQFGDGIGLSHGQSLELIGFGFDDSGLDVELVHGVVRPDKK